MADDVPSEDDVAHATVRAMTEMLREGARPLALACRRAEVADSIVVEAIARKDDEITEARRRNDLLQSLVRQDSSRRASPRLAFPACGIQVAT